MSSPGDLSPGAEVAGGDSQNRRSGSAQSLTASGRSDDAAVIPLSRTPGDDSTFVPFYGDLRALLKCGLGGVVRLDTLGPAGTSSEQAAHHLLADLAEFRAPGEVGLHESFEAAAEAVISGAASALVVANAYSGANAVYVDDRLRLAGAFVNFTPPYGIAAHQDHPWPLSAVRVATHPAPLPLLAGLLPPGLRLGEVIPALSPRQAARRVSEGKADLALTNATSVRQEGLRFVSRTRPIVMLWSVFVRDGDEP